MSNKEKDAAHHSVVSNVNPITEEIDYCTVPEEWIDQSKNEFKYPPPTVPMKIVAKLIKAKAGPQKNWLSFPIRKIHYTNIKTLEAAEKLVNKIRIESSKEASPQVVSKKRRPKLQRSVETSGCDSSSDGDDGRKKSYKRIRVMKTMRKKTPKTGNGRPANILDAVSRSSHSSPPSHTSQRNVHSTSKSTTAVSCRSHSAASSHRSYSPDQDRADRRRSDYFLENPHRRSVSPPYPLSPRHSPFLERTVSPVRESHIRGRSSDELPSFQQIVLKKLDRILTTLNDHTFGSVNNQAEKFAVSSFFPIDSIEDLMEMEKKLSSDKLFSEDVQVYLSCIQADTVSKTTSTLVNRVFSDKLAVCICMKKSESKKIRVDKFKITQMIEDIVMNAFKKYAKSTRECLRPNPVKIKTYMGLRIKNRAYSISKNPTKATDYLIGLEDLASWIQKHPHNVDDVDLSGDDNTEREDDANSVSKELVTMNGQPDQTVSGGTDTEEKDETAVGDATV